MHQPITIATPHLAGGSELLVMASLKPGFVPSLDAMTYKSRTQALLRLLHGARQSQHEYRLLRALSDAVERVGVIHTLRVAVVDGAGPGGGHVLLSVNFDGSYEAYVRTIWQKAPRLLDLIFCNTVGYPTAWNHPLEAWDRWLRSVMVETPFFYAPPGITRQDLVHQRMAIERDRGRPEAELERTRIATPLAEEIAWQRAEAAVDPTAAPGAPPVSTDLPTREAIRQGLQGLAGIYRLADAFRPGTPDGDVLQHAAQELLPELSDFLRPEYKHTYGAVIDAVAGLALVRPLAWFKAGRAAALPPVRKPGPLPGDDALQLPADEVPCGVLRELAGVTDGLMALIAWPTPAAAAAGLQALRPAFEPAGIEPDLPYQLAADDPLLGMALTAEGLRACGLDEAELGLFPIEFRQGMAGRAGLLGDVRGNHPRRWALPPANWAQTVADPTAPDDPGLPRVPTDAVHAVLQLRMASSSSTRAEPGGARRRLLARLQALLASAPGTAVLSVQWMERLGSNTEGDHFGFVDGQSQPRLTPDPARPRVSSQVALGEILAGHANAADREVDLPTHADALQRTLLRNGSFLAVRKLRQHPERLDAAIDAVVSRAPAAGLVPHVVKAKMMGRYPAGSPGPLAGRPTVPIGQGINDFDFLSDPDGGDCPLGAHIRRANPRERVTAQPPTLPPGARTPRLMRRSLPYGPRHVAGQNDAADRGLVFMAYNASLAEQFEVVQRWLAGGNSARGASAGGCPFLGVPEVGRERHFRFEHGGQTVHMPLDGSTDLGASPLPLVSLQWGLYAFAPSSSAWAWLGARATERATARQRDVPWSAQEGLVEIERLRRIEAEQGAAAGTFAWKVALEDPESVADYRAASIWAAVREHFGGALRIPYGVLVADPALVQDVLRNVDARYSVKGYQRRLAPSIGEIFLGMDATDPTYHRLSAACNAAIEQLGFAEGFEAARRRTQEALDYLVQEAIAITNPAFEPEWELTVDLPNLVAQVLAGLCDDWFALDLGQPKGLFTPGPLHWTWQPGDPMFYPGHFVATSRATFQPEPTPEVQALSQLHGQALTKAMRALLDEHHATLSQPHPTVKAPVARAVVSSLWSTSPDETARTLVGALMGFLPTTDGVLRRLLAEWTRDGTLQALSARHRSSALDTWQDANHAFGDELRRAMMVKPVPEQIWRVAMEPHRLGRDPAHAVRIECDDKLVLGLVSATHAGTEDAGAAPDLFPMFGGNRDQAQAPTHACPGYKASIGVILGVISVLLDPARRSAVTPNIAMRTGPGAGALVYAGPMQAQDALADEAEAGTFGKRLTAFDGLRPETLRGPRGAVLGLGDSWLLNALAQATGSSHLAAELAQRGYDTRAFGEDGSCSPGRQLAELAALDPWASGGLHDRLRRHVRAHLQTGAALPVAVLVSGGGNDVKDGASGGLSCREGGAGSPLDAIVKAKGQNPPIHSSALSTFLDTMADHLARVLRDLADAARHPQSRAVMVPLLVHAYDHPYPDGRRSLRVLCPPLSPTFNRRGFTPPGTAHQADTKAVEVMRLLITELNTRYATVVEELYRNEKLPVHFVPLAGTLLTAAGQTGEDYKAFWANELHPTARGFGLLATEVDKAIQTAIKAMQPAP
jgi:deferrochelatase/peroxidase EfeB